MSSRNNKMTLSLISVACLAGASAVWAWNRVDNGTPRADQLVCEGTSPSSRCRPAIFLAAAPGAATAEAPTAPAPVSSVRAPSPPAPPASTLSERPAQAPAPASSAPSAPGNSNSQSESGAKPDAARAFDDYGLGW